MNIKSYNKVDCVGLLVRVKGKPARFFRFATVKRRADVKALYERLQRKYGVVYGYCQTVTGAIF